MFSSFCHCEIYCELNLILEWICQAIIFDIFLITTKQFSQMIYLLLLFLRIGIVNCDYSLILFVYQNCFQA